MDLLSRYCMVATWVNYKAHAGIADDVAVLLNDLYLPLVILGMKVEPDI